jgi:hypothetical protein
VYINFFHCAFCWYYYYKYSIDAAIIAHILYKFLFNINYYHSTILNTVNKNTKKSISTTK